MNTTARPLTALTLLTLIAAALATVFLLREGPTVMQIVQLEPVHMTAPRVPAAGVVQLPLVEVSARRSDATRLVAAPMRNPV